MVTADGWHLWSIRDGLAVDHGRLCAGEAEAKAFAARCTAYHRETYPTMPIEYRALVAGELPPEPLLHDSAVWAALDAKEKRARAEYAKRDREAWAKGRPERERRTMVGGLAKVLGALRGPVKAGRRS